jgi:alkylated DNA repair dioxygenase AlkB
LLFRSLVSPEEVAALCRSTARLPARTVLCGGSNFYLEQQIQPGSPLHQFFQSPPVIGALADCLGRTPDISALRCWTSIYGPGQSINRHRDSGGDLQLVLSLRAAAPENGGWLKLERHGAAEALFLREGDLLCFMATELEHWTTPLIASAENMEPHRITAIARYFLNFAAR